MKWFTVTALLLLTATVLRAEEQTIFGTSPVEHGGYGAVSVKFTSVEDKFGVLVGGNAGWIINHTFVLGAGVWGLARESRMDPMFNSIWGERLRYSLGYGGMSLGFVGWSDQVFHPTFDLLIGGGSLSFYYDERDYDDNNHTVSDDGFFVLEPTVSLEMNITSFMRATVGAGYRMVSGVNKYNLSNGDVSGPAGTIAFKFGKF